MPVSSLVPSSARTEYFSGTWFSFRNFSAYRHSTPGPLSSATPRPISQPSCTRMLKGSPVQPLPAGTTSRWVMVAICLSVAPGSSAQPMWPSNWPVASPISPARASASFKAAAGPAPQGAPGSGMPATLGISTSRLMSRITFSSLARTKASILSI